MFDHKDQLHSLTQESSLHEKLIATHHSIQEIFPFIQRIAIGLFDRQTETVKTFIHSSGKDNPLDHYEIHLSKAKSLQEILEKKTPRVINDLDYIQNSKQEHSRRIYEQGYAASYTMPIYNEGNFVGFLFFNSDQKEVFSESVLRQLDIYGHLISLLVINALNTVNTLSAAVKTTGNLTHQRDPETGSHLDRMSRYSRIIANALAETYDLDDNYIEHIFMFAPLHDIGKIAIPDNVLLKPGSLDETETEIMKSHSIKGREIIDDLLDNFGLLNFQHVEVLKNIAEHHHEAINGSGYPRGLKGNDIPLEARIVAVADVFDALTSKRPYKEAWSNEKAVETLKALSLTTLDKDCVNALLTNMDKVLEIQKQFKEDDYG